MDQDDLLLTLWVKKNLQPPSLLPYNLNFLFSGIDSKNIKERYWSPSQNFIVSKVEELLGDKVSHINKFVLLFIQNY